MTDMTHLDRLQTGLPNLDALLGGGIPRGSLVVFSGPPGSGKSTLAQQIAYHNATPDRRVLVFNTLSEPTAKSLRYISRFAFFEPGFVGDAIHYVDLGEILRSDGLEHTTKLVLRHLVAVKPHVVILDGFKMFDDFAQTPEALRKFNYELTIQLMAWEVTALLIGEYAPQEYETNPLFSIVDGLVTLTQRVVSFQEQRLLQVVKMRGTAHSRDAHPFRITSSGVEVFAPRPQAPPVSSDLDGRCRTDISRLDQLLGEGIPRGSSVLVAGVAGTGKTVMSLEFVYRGAVAGEKGLFISFEETEPRLRSAATGLGWDLDAQLASGMLEILFIPQPDIDVEANLEDIRVHLTEGGARRIAIDSLSVFLHKVQDPVLVREKIFQVTSLIASAGAVGFLPTDIPYGKDQVSRFGLEETVADGVLLLTAKEEGLERRRYVEVYKLRNTAHLKGRHIMSIGQGGVDVFPRYSAESELDEPPAAVDADDRIGTGVPDLDPLIGGGLMRRSVTLLSGSAGVGKSTLALQFALEAARTGERALYVTLEEGPDQLRDAAERLGLHGASAMSEGTVEVMYLSRSHVRAAQYLAILDRRVKELGATRIVIDGATHLVAQGFPSDELRQLLQGLVLRFRKLSATSLVTLESDEMHHGFAVADLGLSPLADNLIVLRYDDVDGGLRPNLLVVKSRGSTHDRRLFEMTIGQGGITLAPHDGAAPRG